MINEEKNKMNNTDETLILVLNILRKGTFEKKRDAFIVRKADNEDYVIHINEKALELRIITTRWVKGNYEPIKSSEVIRSVEHKELAMISLEERNKRIADTIKELMN